VISTAHRSLVELSVRIANRYFQTLKKSAINFEEASISSRIVDFQTLISKKCH
jgi:hypothetical protein